VELKDEILGELPEMRKLSYPAKQVYILVLADESERFHYSEAGRQGNLGPAIPNKV
jgi:hypothetical protein